jgi:two-component system, chemotaxis family, CheB/CheR fusion protein
MPELQNKNTDKKLSENLFPVVGVGASAGGLEAFKKFIKAIPDNSGIAFILVQHLEPSHESMLTDLLQKVTDIPVQEITNDVRVEPNRIYIIPSNKILTANDGVLQLSERPPKNVRNMPIDVFFRSLAEVHQSHAIGVVLSGAATDGTLGLKSIKEYGGITFAQDPQSAGFYSMPQSAIDAGVVDFILPPEEIVLKLINLNQAFKEVADDESKPDDTQLSGEVAFRKILAVIRTRKGADFTHYKQTTIRRRIIRRMGLSRVENTADYLLLIKNSNEEQELLYQDLLIPVTDFFRDQKIYDIICEKLFPLLFTDRENGNPLRIWVAGCSTGEEAYSMAICLREYMENKGSGDTQIRLFATDISEKSIAKARTGIYSKKSVASLSADRLEKYFTKVNGDYQVNRHIRDMIVFAHHNFLKDPPFAKMDFISCRNVLIYLEPSLQKKALTIFHYALRDNGYLLLGKSESTGPVADLFTIFNKNEKLFQRKPFPGRLPYSSAEAGEKPVKEKDTPFIKEPVPEGFQKNADDILLSKYSPPGVVVNELMEIVQFRGSTGAWLEAPAGKPTMNVIKMAREGLGFEIRNALYKVKSDNIPFIKKDISVRSKGLLRLVSIEVIPLLNTAEPFYLVLFIEGDNFHAAGSNAEKDARQPLHEIMDIDAVKHIERLENELLLNREDMRSITEDQEAVNEELQSANEELLSGSEELQSLNEELESSKEEIQSTNEELTTMNHEIMERNDELNKSRLFAESIIATIREPLIVLDKNLRVRTANKSFYDKFKTDEQETEGKLFYELGGNQWDVPELRNLLDTILTDEKKVTGFEIKKDFNPLGERAVIINATMIYRKDNPEQLILLAIEDITEIKKMEAELKIFNHELENIVTERTVKLDEANTSLKRSNENLQQFATIASHDLQEPLRKILTFANLLNLRHSGDIKEEARELLGKISVSAERMSALITGVLNFSRITDSSKEYVRTDLNEVLDKVISDFDLLIKQKSALVSHNRLPVIDAVPIQMNQLFYNLLGNTLKFSREDSPPEIRITAEPFPASAVVKYPGLSSNYTYCKIIFSDNGIGFDSEFAEQIFLIFQRLNPREHFEGTGIGLALCKRIVINHHGEIYAESIPDEGAQFHIILPVKQ